MHHTTVSTVTEFGVEGGGVDTELDSPAVAAGVVQGGGVVGIGIGEEFAPGMDVCFFVWRWH